MVRPTVELLEERRVLTTIAWPPAPGSNEELGERIVASFRGTLDEVNEGRDFVSEQTAAYALGALAVDYWAELLGQDVTAELERSLYTLMPLPFEAVEMISTGVATMHLQATAVDLTNVRTPGIDEADHAEMLGDGLYLVSSGQQAQIFDVSAPEGIRWVGDIEVGHNNRFIYSDGRLAVISDSLHRNDAPFWGGWVSPLDESTVISTYDLSDPARPSLISTTEIDGNVHSAHLVDSTLIVGANFTRRPPELGLVPVEPEGGEAARFRFETEQEYLSRVADSIVAQFVGDVRTLDAAGNVLKQESAGGFRDVNIAAMTQQHGVNATAVMAFDFGAETLALVDSESIVGADFAFSYVDADSVYSVDRNEGSKIYEFTRDDDGIEFTASGSVPGQILSSRSMDEFDGVLRVFTSAEDFFGQERSDLYVLQSADGTLETVGQLVDIADGQSQFGVTFEGDIAYVTTAEFTPDFVFIDPLHVIDLSAPAAPVELSELDIPGIVTSLRRVGESHLVGVGFAESETQGWLMRQVTLFDVSDQSAPKIVENWVGDNEAPGWGLFGDWTTREMSIRYVADAGLLTIDGGFAEVEVFRIDAAADAPVEHVANLVGERFTGPRTRSFVDDDYIVVSSGGVLKSVSLDDPSGVADQVALGDPLVPDDEWIYSDSNEIVLRPLDNDRLGNTSKISRISDFEGVADASIGSDGRSIVLSRDSSGYAEVWVEYEIALADGRVVPSSLTTIIRPQEFVGTPDIKYVDASGSFSLSASDEDGAPVSTVQVGDEFWITLTADWERSDQSAIFAAYADIEFDTNVFRVIELEYLPEFGNGMEGEVTNDGVTNLGGFAGRFDGGMLGARDIARVRVEVIGEGDMRLDAKASAGIGYEFLVFDESWPIDSARVTGVPLILKSSESETAETQLASEYEITDVDQDGYTSAIDALYLVNEINRRVGGGSGEQASQVWGRDSSTVSPAMLDRMDISGDGELSAIDVLHVVNYINANVGNRHAEGESLPAEQVSIASQSVGLLSDTDLSALAASQAMQWADDLRKSR
ncbi:MAG: hypothetical protein Aurels2KO_15320 [Aureliella sp.]